MSSSIPGACSNSCPLSWWYHPTISSSVVPFSFCPQSFPASGSFPMSKFFAPCGQSIGASASASVLPMNIQDWFPLGWNGWISLQSKGLSRIFSNTTVQKHQFFSAQFSLWSNSHIHGEGNDNSHQYSCLENPVDWRAWWAAFYGVAQIRTWLKWFSMHACIGEGNGNPLQYSCLENPRDRGAWWAAICGVAHSHAWLKQLSSSSSSSHPYMTTGETTALTRWTFVDKIMSLLFNMLSRLKSLGLQGDPTSPS